nr:immunoglobulin heavy chain junction region [Mus musculus]
LCKVGAGLCYGLL